MDKDLEQHIKDIFNSLGIEMPFNIYEYGVDPFPDWSSTITDKCNYLICCRAVNQKERLSRFTGKDIRINGDTLYWFEGEPINSYDNVDNSSPILCKPTAVYNKHNLKNSTRLPSWLDEYIFKNLNAIYLPDYKIFETNLDSSESKNLQYLGTYFPRTYAESFCLFNFCFQSRGYVEILSQREELSILSIGCGNGGDIVGLLTIIEKYLSNITEINISAIDGNNYALGTLELIISQFRHISKKTINLKVINVVIDDFSEFEDDRVDTSYDFILSFKAISEMISSENGYRDDAYYKFAKRFIPILSNNGLCAIVDVTTKSIHSTFNPILLNNQINKAINEIEDISTFIPYSCCLNESHCDKNCFFQSSFFVSHSKHSKDKGKIVYRIIGHNSLLPLLTTDKLLSGENFCYYSQENISVDNNSLDITEKPKKKCDNATCEEHKSEIIISETALRDEETPVSVESELIDYYQGCFVIDTNVFVECPDIIDKISEDYFIILSAKVLEELDYLKVKKNISQSRKKKVGKALRNINEKFEIRDIELCDSDLRLLPKDFDKNNPDNKILSVALKNLKYAPILLTSDNALQIRAKGLDVKTISLKDYLKTINTSVPLKNETFI